MAILLWIIGATFIVSLISLIGIFSLAIKEKVFDKILLALVGFSAGALIGSAFLHLLPEAFEKTTHTWMYVYTLIGFSTFFLIEKFLKWHHCHKGKCDVHTFTYMNLIGDGVHNFIDGLIIAASFLVSIPFGITTTVVIMVHEVPQEIGDFAILVYGGFKKTKALFFNFLSAVTSIIGAVFGCFLSTIIKGATFFLIPFAAGSFIYIAASDLIPELHKETDIKKSLLSFTFFIIGILFMFFMKLVLVD